MDIPEKCPACGADWSDGKTCEDHFHQMLFWENEYPDYTLMVHHFLVACYHIQHPHLYSPEGLAFSINLLRDFLTGIDPQEKGRQLRKSGTVNSIKRTWKVTGTPDSHGSYPTAIPWTMFARDVTSRPVESYEENIRAWARSIYEALKAAGIAT
jgi:hypothetical protein